MRIVQRLSEGLVKRKHEVTVITSQHMKTLPRQAVIGGVKIVRVPSIHQFARGQIMPTFLPELVMQAKYYDVVNIHTPLFEIGPATLGIYCATGKKPIVTYVCDLSMRYGTYGLLAKFVETVYYKSVDLACKVADKIVVLSEDYAATSRIRKYSKKMVSIAPPINTEIFYPVDQICAREKFSLGEGIIVGFAGRLVYEKGLRYLIEATPLMMDEIPDAKIVIVGEGEKIAGGTKESVKPELMRLMQELNLRNVIFLGNLEPELLREFFSACDVLVLPSIDRLEAFGMVQVEALLCGIPVVSTNLPGVREVVRLTGGGIVVPPKDNAKLADAIIRVVKNKKKFVVPRDILLQYFAIEKTIERYERLFYQSLE